MTTFEDEREMSRAELAAWLRQLADQLDAGGEIRYGAGDEAGTISVPEQVEVELEIEQSGNIGSVEIEVTWGGEEEEEEEEEEEAEEEEGPQTTGAAAQPESAPVETDAAPAPPATTPAATGPGATGTEPAAAQQPVAAEQQDETPTSAAEPQAEVPTSAAETSEAPPVAETAGSVGAAETEVRTPPETSTTS